jgi:hypothetical protein
MRRFAWTACGFALVLLLCAVGFASFLLTHPSGLVTVNDAMPPDLALMRLFGSWLPIVVTLALASAVSALFAFAVDWTPSSRGRPLEQRLRAGNLHDESAGIRS